MMISKAESGISLEVMEKILKTKSSLIYVNFYFFNILCHTACGILVSQPEAEHTSPALKGQSLNHWTARKSQPDTC